MRIKRAGGTSEYKVIVVDDEIGIVDSLTVMLNRMGYDIVGETDPEKAVERIRNEHFDLLILDFLMYPLHGDEVVQKIREFNKDLYILLLTGHNDLAPPLETLKALDIQGYCEKSDKFDQLILLVESGFKALSMVNTIKKFQDGINKILQAVPKIYQLQPLGSILEEILAEILPLVHSKNAFILVDDVTNISAELNKSIVKGIGKYKTGINDFMDMLNPEFMERIGHARTTKQTVLDDKNIILPLKNEFLETIGVICVEREDENNDLPEQGVKLLEIYANQAASSLNNAFLHSLVNMKNEELNKTYDQLKSSYLDTIEALRLVVDAKDIYTRGHSDRVSYYAVKLGKKMGLADGDVEILRIAGLFHDVGKIGTADDILSKSESLNVLEYEEIKKHPLRGAHILSAVSMFKSVVPVVKYHHERIDGRGYPEGITGNQMPLLSKIISVVDAFDAMSSDRHYRSTLGLKESKNQLTLGAGTQFDAEIVNVFIELLQNYDTMQHEIQTFLKI